MNEFNASRAAEAVDTALRGAIECNLPLGTIRNAVEYALFPAGKRIRPRLAMSICSDLGADPISIAPSAAAIELLHSASLIHDDLPALDNDDYRRGKPSLHRQFGEAVAILVGDLMTALAFNLVTRQSIAPERSVSISESLSRAFCRLCEGQVNDIAPQHGVDELLKRHAQKTGALFGAALAIGAIGARGAECVSVEHVEHSGIELGIAFQLIDDMADMRGTAVERGRPAGSDQKNDRITAQTELSRSELGDLFGRAISEFRVKLAKGTGLPIENLESTNLVSRELEAAFARFTG